MIMFEHRSRRTLLDDQQLPTPVLWNDVFVRFGSAVRYRTHVAPFVPLLLAACSCTYVLTPKFSG